MKAAQQEVSQLSESFPGHSLGSTPQPDAIHAIVNIDFAKMGWSGFA
jgi:hypothetical protein